MDVCWSQREESCVSSYVLGGHVVMHVDYSSGSNLSYHDGKKAYLSKCKLGFFTHFYLHVRMVIQSKVQLSIFSSLVPLVPTVLGETELIETVMSLRRPIFLSV
jgi:hypothetical protein